MIGLQSQVLCVSVRNSLDAVIQICTVQCSRFGKNITHTNMRSKTLLETVLSQNSGRKYFVHLAFNYSV